MTEVARNPEPHLTAIFESALNRHGHPFQYAVIRRADQLNSEGRSPWVFEASEFRVEVQGYHTRIDFVLSRWGEAVRGPLQFLVAECKRANPSLHDWLFTRAPYVRRGSSSRDILVECLRREGTDLNASLGRLDGSENIYHVAVEVKSAAKGDASGTGRGAIEEAATQVTRGVNGLIERFSRNRRYIVEHCPVTFVPAIFTTARIWATDVDIAASVNTGEVKLDASKVTAKPWLWFQYHISPGLRHSLDRHVQNDEPFRRIGLADLLELEYARTVAIVGTDGTDAFLASQRWS